MQEIKKLKINTTEVRVIIDMNIETGEYDVTFRNISDPGGTMDYNYISEMLRRVLYNLDNKIDCEGEC